MALTPRLETKQSQSLLLTPQLRQAISLLQMTNLELNELIEQELQNNPLLEREDDHLANTQDTHERTIDDINEDNQSLYDGDQISNDSDYQNEFDDFGSDTEGYDTFETTDWSDYNQSKNKQNDENAFDYFEKKLSQEKSLYTIIDEQINLNFTSNTDRIIAKILSEHLDGAGYFRGDLNKISSLLNTPVSRLQMILTKLKTFEPSGIFAETLSECLKIQLSDNNQLTPELNTLLDNLTLIAERKFKELAKLCQCTSEHILKLITIIKSLNPKPTISYSNEQISYIIPDIFVKRSPSGEYRVELNSMSLPKLLINHTYYAELKNNKKASRYLKENLSHANFLLKAMHQRATSILRVSEEIILRQYHFFEKGIEYLKPMSLRDIAEALSINESTVSRVTSGKYMSTPRGIFELKYFFSTAAGSYIGSDDTSTTTIKHKIKLFIDNEDPKHILSDDKIVELLGQEGIKIARRTVTKYREAMGLPTSSERKRTKLV